MSTASKPKLQNLRGTTTQDNAAFLVATCTLAWYDMGPSTAIGDTRKQVANGSMHTITPGTVFRSKAELKAQGVDDASIDGWIRNGALRYQTIQGLQRGSLSITAPGAPVTLGNVSSAGDGAKVHENRPGVKWGWHPENLKDYDLEGLQALIASADPSIEPPDSVQLATEILCQEFDQQ